MTDIAKKPIKITETILRDAHQSLIATRMTTEQMLPIVDTMDKVGYHSVECWGGATFDASLRFLKEDPWERLRKFRDGFKNTKLQMLFRGQNILGYRPYADDVVEYFVQKSIANGIDIIRIFDCLNDMRNLQTAVKAANKEKGHAQVALSYTLGDAYTLEYWTNIAKEIEEMQQYFPVICGEWCLFNSLACGWDTKGGQTVLNGLDGASVESYTPEEKKKIYNAIAKVQTEAWNKGSGYFYWSYKLLTDTVNTEGWVGWDSWDLGRCIDFGWFDKKDL